MVDKLEAVEQVLGKPVAAEFSDDALKVRRNLLVASFVSIVSVVGGVHVDPGSTVFGLKFSGLTPGLINCGLLIITSYLVLHFGWYFFDSLLEWRLRVTGTRLAFITAGTYASDDADYPANVRQSTLYNWWKGKSAEVALLTKLGADVGPKIEGLGKLIATGHAPSQESIEQLRSEFKVLMDYMDRTRSVLAEPRVAVSLRRFDRWFALFLRSQNLRWLLIDAGMPLIAGLCTVLLLVEATFLTR